MLIQGQYEVVHTTRHGDTVATPLGYFGINDDPAAKAARIAQQAGGKVVRVSWVSY